MFYSQNHNVVVIKTDNSSMISGALAGAKRLNDEYIAIPATLPNLQTLWRLGISVPPPMALTRYDWPIRSPWHPLEHQQTTSNFLVLNPRSFCFNDMGTMKTLSALWAADYLIQQADAQREVFRWLIVAPLSTLHSVWGLSIFNHFMGRRKCAILHGSEDRRRRELEKNVDFYIINPDGLRVGFGHDPATRRQTLSGLALDLSKRHDIRGAIVDEASAFRDHRSDRSQAARTLFGGREYLWLLTGTPTSNGPLDAYGLGKLVGSTGNESFKSYKDRVMFQAGKWKWVPRAGSAAIAASILRPSIRFEAKFLNLPPQTAERREVKFSYEQAQAYKVLKRDAILAVKSGALITAVNEAALRIKLIQVCCGCVYDSNHVSHGLHPLPRLQEVESIIEETSRKIVIFAPLTNVLHMLRERLKKKWECEIVNGEIPLASRNGIFRRFGDPKDTLRVLLADPASVAHGVNDLVSANVVIWYGGTDKSELYAQGNKRIDRPGQTHSSKVIQLVSGKVEHELYDRLERNQSLQGLILKFSEEL